MLLAVASITCLNAEDEEADDAAAALVELGQWKATGKEAEGFLEHAILGERTDLVEWILGGDKLAETEIKAPGGATNVEGSIQAREPVSQKMKEDDNGYPTVWSRITRNRFEIWTPKVGKLFDEHDMQLAETTVRRGDGHGREWYGAFLPDGRWITTDLDDYDRDLTMFSAKGKRQWKIKGSMLIPAEEGGAATPSIAWARSNQSGDAWIVSVGSEEGRGQVKVMPDGQTTRIESPWGGMPAVAIGPSGDEHGKVHAERRRSDRPRSA
jgi:hypothetical protein